MILVAIIIGLFNLSIALPIQEVIPQNVITVPPNCPEGQELVNGQCRDIWRWRNNPDTADVGVIDPSFWYRNRNVITVPPNCPSGQQWINGACRDVWRYFIPTSPIPTQFEYLNMELRQKRQLNTDLDIVDSLELFNQVDRNIINIPNQCPTGYRPDALGICRKILE